ncbi:hypothetical protein WDW37_09595 [Bdellovibrionota bacterium FG-1]
MRLVAALLFLFFGTCAFADSLPCQETPNLYFASVDALKVAHAWIVQHYVFGDQNNGSLRPEMSPSVSPFLLFPSNPQDPSPGVWFTADVKHNDRGTPVSTVAKFFDRHGEMLTLTEDTIEDIYLGQILTPNSYAKGRLILGSNGVSMDGRQFYEFFRMRFKDTGTRIGLAAGYSFFDRAISLDRAISIKPPGTMERLNQGIEAGGGIRLIQTLGRPTKEVSALPQSFELTATSAIGPEVNDGVLSLGSSGFLNFQFNY